VSNVAYDREVDCPWFEPEWLRDHPEFPLAATVAAAINKEKESAS
jgi:hypothetical protein